MKSYRRRKKVRKENKQGKLGRVEADISLEPTGEGWFNFEHQQTDHPILINNPPNDISFRTTAAPGDILFSAGGEAILELHENGDIYVRGNLTTNDMEVVNGMRDFFR